MTLEDVARHYGKSVRTVYRRIQKSGLRLEDLRDSDGNLSEDALGQFATLFDKVTLSNVTHCRVNDTVPRQFVKVTQGGEIEKLRADLAAAEARATAAEAARAEAEARISSAAESTTAADARAAAAEAEARRLSDRVDDLTRQLSEMRATLDDVRSDRDEWRRAASEARALQMQQMRLLPERVSIAQRVRGWFARTKTEDN